MVLKWSLGDGCSGSWKIICSILELWIVFFAMEAFFGFIVLLLIEYPVLRSETITYPFSVPIII